MACYETYLDFLLHKKQDEKNSRLKKLHVSIINKVYSSHYIDYKKERFIVEKIRKFIVKGRYLILGIMIVLTAISGLLMTKVNVNTDLTKYLPDSSQMKQGMDIMEEEFPEMANNSLHIMFEDLSVEDQEDIKMELQSIQNVESVSFDSKDTDYQKEVDGTLYSVYILNISADEGSKEDQAVESKILELYEGYHNMTYTMDDVSEALPPWILMLAVGILMVILFIMCGSWIEPILFLATIGVAIVINLGTNIFLPSVSNVTMSIAAILQLALSMDYSIILMNRYKHELQEEDNKIHAMEKALHVGFKAIVSSSLTTVVGLLALVFMSFKIGADMGIVLAKGVFLSLICIFTVLPGLILLFDQIIKKTEKRVFVPKMDRVGKFSHRFRYVVLAVFVVFFAIVVFMKGNTPIAYTLVEPTEINKIFPDNNQIVLLYNANEADEAEVSNLIETLEANQDVKSVTSYENTLGKQYTSDELLNAFTTLTGETEGISFDDSMMKLLYYMNFADVSEQKMTMEDFFGFLSNMATDNELLQGQVDEEMLSSLTLLSIYTNLEQVTMERSSLELSVIFDMDQDILNQLIPYYYMQTGQEFDYMNPTMSIATFVEFAVNSLLNNPEYARMFTEATTLQLQMLYGIVMSTVQGIEYSSEEMYQVMLNYSDTMSEEDIQLIYSYYYSQLMYDDTWKMSIEEFVEFLVFDVMNQDRFASYFDENSKQMLNDAISQIEEGSKLLQSGDYSRILLTTTYPPESEETYQFLEELDKYGKSNFNGDSYIISNSQMAYEMSESFRSEFNTISIITAVAIFIVVAIAFRSIIVPLVLVLVIQGSVYATIMVIGLQGYSIFYLALIIVQCILMGATIDYGILYMTYYRENRKKEGIKQALIDTYHQSMHTILTSGLIMVLVTGILGKAFRNPTTGQICETISKGAMIAIVLIVFILPGIVATIDKFLVKKNTDRR